MNLEQALKKATGLTPLQYRNKAVEGGWLVNGRVPYINGYIQKGTVPPKSSMVEIEAMLLDPKSWQAVSKVEKWGKLGMNKNVMINGQPQWLIKQHNMLDTLAE